MATEYTIFKTDKNGLYYRYNPIIHLAIRPALRLADAHNHPIRGGFAAAIASGIAHYASFEIAWQASDYFLGTNISDPQTKLVLTTLPWYAQLSLATVVGVNMISNIAAGIGIYTKRNNQSPIDVYKAK